MKSMYQAVKGKALAIVSLASLAPVAAFADTGSTFDYSAVTTAGTTVAAITGAVFLVYVAIKVGSWARRAL